jgi:predicted DNA-binding transcriptional regulator YafY
MLRPGFFLPPLMFSPEELEALVLGARWVEAQPDAGLADAARNALGKIATASPQDLRDRIRDTGLWPVLVRDSGEALPVLGQLRAAMRSETALHITYADEGGQKSERHIWPVQLSYYEGKQVVVAWCEMRGAFRHFRTDRIVGAIATDRRYGRRRRQLTDEWYAEWSKRNREWLQP